MFGRSFLAIALVSVACAEPAVPDRWIEPQTGMVFVRIPPVQGRAPFWLGAYEVTQAQWEQVMDRDNPAWFHDESGRLPMENVNLFEVRRFIERMNARAPGSGFRLPTESEWEWACHASTAMDYATGATLTPADANIAPSPERAAEGGTVAVGSYAANAWGLFDMHGNVWEWTSDVAGDLQIIRGGSWYFGADSARCGLRYTHRPQDRGFSVGFRLARGG